MTSRRDVARPSAAPVTLSEDTMQRMLSLQEQRLQLEIKQADLSLREIDHNQKLADRTISAQAEDLKDERAHSRSMSKQRLIFGGVVVAMLVGFAAYAIHIGRDAIVLDLVKVVLGFVGGWGGSIMWQHRKGANQPQRTEGGDR